MNFKMYQIASRETAIYPNVGSNHIYPALGLAGETGEVMEKLKKIMRDKNNVIDDAERNKLEGELGDVLWYVSNLCSELNLDMQTVAEKNLEKLFSRKERNVLHGSGDSR